MDLREIQEYLRKKYPRFIPKIVLNAIRFDPLIIDFDPGTGDTHDDDNEVVTELYAVAPLTYITLEKEDLTLVEPNILRIFSFARGLDAEQGIVPSSLIMDVIEAKFGRRPNFGPNDYLNSILGWQGRGLWRAGVQLFLVNNIDEFLIERGIQYADSFGSLVSAINIRDLWRVGSKLGTFSEEELASIMVNLHARIFENETANLLRRKFEYAAVNRYRPPYLKKPLDVFAAKRSTDYTRITICECKLTLNERAITEREVLAFKQVAEKVKAVEMEQIETGWPTKIFRMVCH